MKQINMEKPILVLKDTIPDMSVEEMARTWCETIRESPIIRIETTPSWHIATEDTILHDARVLLDRENTPDHKRWLLCRGCVYIQRGEAWLNLEDIECLPTI